VVSGHVPPGHETSLVNWDALGKMTGTLVVIMGVKNGPAIAERLVEAGRAADTPAAVIQEGTTENQRVFRCTLGTLGETITGNDVRPPAVLVIGDVAAQGL